MNFNLNPDFFQEETRCDFLVTKKRKKIWAVELEILSVFDEICKKYNLNYFLFYGSLLGTIRHQGFIPWDDDMDVVMFRPDYERLKEVIRDELKEPYFFQDVYSDSILLSFAKIRDGRTTAIEKKFCENASPNQGIFIDIFPLDAADPFSSTNIEAIEKELWTSVSNPDLIRKIIQTPQYPCILPRDLLQDLLNMPLRNRFRQYEAFLIDQFDSAAYVGVLPNMLVTKICFQKSWFDHPIYLPFEHLTVPVPSGYDEILTTRYGNYHSPIPGYTLHQDIIMDPDKSYLEYYKEMGCFV